MLYSQACSPVKSRCHVGVPYGNLGSWLLWGHPSSQDAVRGGAGICLHRVKERHHRGRPNSSSESSAKHSRHASERRKSPSRSPGQRSSSWSSSGSLSKSRSRSREKRAARSRSRSPSPKKPASRSGPGGHGHGDTAGASSGLRERRGSGWSRGGVASHCWSHWKCQLQVGVSSVQGTAVTACPCAPHGTPARSLTVLLLPGV